MIHSLGSVRQCRIYIINSSKPLTRHNRHGVRFRALSPPQSKLKETTAGEFRVYRASIRLL